MKCIERGMESIYEAVKEKSNRDIDRAEMVNSQTEVKVYRLNPDGSKGKFLRAMPAFPGGWEKKKFALGKRKQQKKEDNNMAKPREDREEILAKAKVLMAKGLSLNQASKKLDVPIGTLGYWVKQDEKQQTPAPEPAEAVNQEPERESQEPAGNSVAQEEPLAQKEQGFGPEDEEPIPYVPVSLEKMVIELRDDLDLERHKVAALEKKMELLASALPAGSRTSQENRLAKLLVAVFRELGDAGTA